MKKDGLGPRFKEISNQAIDLFIKSFYSVSVPIRPNLSRKKEVIIKNEAFIFEVKDPDQSSLSYEGVSFHLYNKANKEICNVGLRGFYNLPKPENSVVVCYNTASDFQNQGFCSFLLKEALEVLENETSLNRVLASIFNNNQASLSLIKKNGFQYITSTPFGLSTVSDSSEKNDMSSWEKIFLQNQKKEIA